MVILQSWVIQSCIEAITDEGGIKAIFYSTTATGQHARQELRLIEYLSPPECNSIGVLLKIEKSRMREQNRPLLTGGGDFALGMLMVSSTAIGNVASASQFLLEPIPHTFSVQPRSQRASF